MGQVRIRPMVEADWPAVQAICDAVIATGDATFELEPPEGWAAFDAARLPGHRFVAVTDAILGWITASPVSRRPAYAGLPFAHFLQLFSIGAACALQSRLRTVAGLAR